MNIKLTLPNARVPERANEGDAGADLFSPVEVIVRGKGTAFVDFGVQVEIPDGYVGQIYARSGLGGRGIIPRNCVGIIDCKYRGNLGMMVKNDSDVDYKIEVGSRIAQFVVVPVITPTFNVVEEFEDEVGRNGGFGSTGV